MNKKGGRACASSPMRPQGDKKQFPKEPSGLAPQRQATPARQRPEGRTGNVAPVRVEPRPAADGEVGNAAAAKAGTWKVNVGVPEEFRLVRYRTATFVDRAAGA